MAPLPPALLSTLLGLAGRSRTPDLMARLREETLAMLQSSAPLPGHVVNHVIASADRELLTALAKGTPPRRLPVLLRLAALGDPRLARTLYGRRLRQDLETRLRRAVLAGAAKNLEDPGWRAPGGLVSFLLSTRASDDLVPALSAPFPEVVRHAAAVLEAAVLEAGLRPENAPAPDDGDLVNRLRTTVGRYQVFSLEDIDVDWEAILAEHRTKPFPAGALATLASRPDCPDELVLAAYRACQGTNEQPILPWALLRGTDRGDDSPYGLRLLFARGIARGRYPAHGVLAEVRPARQVLAALPFREETVRQATAELVRPLGADFATWRALYALLPRFAGTATELVAGAVEQSVRHRGKDWPRPLGPEFPAKHPEGGRAAFLRLFHHASDDVQSAVVRHLDLRSVQHLLLFHPPSPVVRDRVVALHGRSVLALVASRWDLPAERIQELIVHDDPEINTCLYVHTDLTDEQRRGILVGRRFGTGGGTEPLPVTGELVQELECSGRRHWLLPIRDSGDPRLVRILLGKVKLQTPAGQLLPLVRMWERYGASDVAALLDETEFGGRERRKHPLTPETHTLVRKALEAPDGLAVLREELATAQAPAAQAAILRGLGRQAPGEIDTMLDRLSEETGLSWEGLAEEHDRDPLPDSVIVRIARREDCPEDLRRHSAPADLRLRHDAHPHDLTGPRPGARDLLRRHRLPRTRPDEWLSLALKHGQLTLLDVVREARPARPTVLFLAHRPLDARERADVPAYRELRTLVATHLGDDPEAWAVALRLLSDFPGTLPELLTTTAAVVS
ncbi:hypothetical protein [Streptomyces coffeae]|uniref:Secreted protein n=1 Tax=Streptomyces coffeae TaxID=621382 RepID=A0ABS1N6P7_9ACTN|nr:hypothetical protein [Streptomyces coffeae]MBL1095625.1 hypothetical protein [Streptomyces coffeae]